MAESIKGEGGEYFIEPIRHRHGMSRVEMVDYHLAVLASFGAVRSPDVDMLLDARARYEMECVGDNADSDHHDKGAGQQ